MTGIIENFLRQIVTSDESDKSSYYEIIFITKVYGRRNVHLKNTETGSVHIISLNSFIKKVRDREFIIKY